MAARSQFGWSQRTTRRRPTDGAMSSRAIRGAFGSGMGLATSGRASDRHAGEQTAQQRTVFAEKPVLLCMRRPTTEPLDSASEISVQLGHVVREFPVVVLHDEVSRDANRPETGSTSGGRQARTKQEQAVGRWRSESFSAAFGEGRSRRLSVYNTKVHWATPCGAR